MYRKAQNMSLNTIVIAALVVLVLVILAAVFMGGMGSFTSGYNDCLKRGGSCEGASCDSGQTEIPGVCYGGDGEKDDYYKCCKKLD